MEQQHAHRIDVAARIERLAARLFGRHVLGRTDDHALRGHARRTRPTLEELRDAEVADLHDVVRAAFVVLALEDHDVLGLEVTMDDAEVVRDRERRQRLTRDVDDARHRERALLVDDLRERLAVDVFHRDVKEAVGLLAEVDDAHRARMVDARCGLRLAEEAGREHRFAGELPVQDLDGERRPERGLPGLVHRAHRAFADEGFEAVFPRDRAPDECLLLHEARRYRTPHGWAILRPNCGEVTSSTESSPRAVRELN